MSTLNLAAAAALALAAVITPTPTPTPVVPTPTPVVVPTVPVPTPSLPVPTPAPGDEVSIAQLCLLTNIPEINEALSGLTESDLVGSLAPLLDITVADDESVEIDGSLQFADVRNELNCDDVDGEPTPTLPPGLPDGDDNGDGGAGDGDGGITVPNDTPETGGR